MSIKKYTDWSAWWVGLRTNLIKCIGTTGTAWLGSNGLASTGIPGTNHIGIDWRQAVGIFGVHIAFEVFSYLRDHQPEEVTQECDTAQITQADEPPQQ